MADKAIALKAEKPKSTAEKAPDAFAKPEPAFLEMWEPKHVKGGKPELGTKKDEIKFQFNPKEVSITKSAKWERKPTKEKKAGPPEYSGAEPCKLTLELFFDATMNSGVDVVKSVDKLFSCCVPCKEVKKGEQAMPFLVVFNWGSVRSFAAYISQVQAKFTRFAPSGIPIRAVCTVNLEEIDVTPDPKQNPTSGSFLDDSVHTMVTGDSLALLAYQEYGDPQLWRPLAAYNDIDDPMRIPDGTQLRLPKLDALLTPVG
jgi:Contractile injection system tube protein